MLYARAKTKCDVPFQENFIAIALSTALWGHKLFENSKALSCLLKPYFVIVCVYVYDMHTKSA